MAIVPIKTGLLDARGRPIVRQELTKEVAGPSITGVRSPITSYPGDGLNPVRLASILRDADAGMPIRQLELAETVEERDTHIVGILGTRKRSISQLEITVEDGSDDAEHQKHGQVVREWLKRDELGAELFDMLDAIHKGYSFTEIIWDTSMGQWSPARLEWRDPRWFDFERHDLRTPQLIDEGGGREPLPGGKFIYAPMAAKSGIPTRAGLSRVLAWAWLFKALTNRDWAIFTQTYGQPVRIGKYGQGSTDDDRKALYRAVANIAGDMAAIIPDSMKIEFVESGSVSASSDLYDKRVTHLNLEASKAVLGQTTTTDAVSGGHAVSQEHRLVQEDIERSDAKQLAAHINRDLVRVWIDLQFGPQKAYPRIRIGRPEPKDVKQIVEVVRGLGLRMKRSEAYELAGISEPGPADEVIEPGRAGNPAAAPGQQVAANDLATPPADALAQAIQADLGDDPAALGVQLQVTNTDRLAVDTGDRTAAAMDFIHDLLKSIVAEASDMEDVRNKLLELAPNIGARPLAQALRQAIVVAELTGRADLIDASAEPLNG